MDHGRFDKDFNHIFGDSKPMPENQVGAAIFTTVRICKPDGSFEDIQVVSAEAVLEVLRNPCVKKLKAGEPFFVLRGQDVSAPIFVEGWASYNKTSIDPQKFAGAQDIAVRMRNWLWRKSPS